MLVPMALPPQIAVRSDGPAIALSEAERMTPAALADVLLASGHPPIVEADVVIYAGAPILGRITIGRGSTIGGSVWLTHADADRRALRPPGRLRRRHSAEIRTRPAGSSALCRCLGATRWPIT